MISNFKKLFTIEENGKDRIIVFEGIRAISMMWIIAGHGYSIWDDRLPESNNKYEQVRI